MKLFTIVLLCIGTMAYSQNTIEVKVIDSESKAALLGATIDLGGGFGGVTNSEGSVQIADIPDGSYTVKVSFVGYETHSLALVVPHQSTTLMIELTPGHELEEVVVTTTRSSRTIDDIPTRIEAISTEELAEKAIMRSSNIAMVLRESTGIQMQVTSASSANQSIRIQGLDGRYTQLLKDGFPMYGGFASGLSIMQIPPLDLKQVEVIKGSNSTLYGGGAIAGLVNLVTHQPEEEKKAMLMLDQSQAGGSTVNAFYAKKNGKLGVTLFTSANRQQAYDSNDDDFSDLPQIRSLTLNPSIYYYIDDLSTLRLTLNATLENRLGGDMSVINDRPSGIHQFTEENRSKRYAYQLSFRKELKQGAILTAKNSITYFDRRLVEPNYTFSANQVSSFSELSYSILKDKLDWVAGFNLYVDNFDESPFDNLDRSYNQKTIGAFGQNTFSVSEKNTLEIGLRVDYNPDYDVFVLPRVSFLTKFNQSLTMRVGGGFGYKLPTIFTEQAENLSFENILPISSANSKAERSLGTNVDFNFKTYLGDNWTFSINQLFFYTRLQDALVFRQNTQNQYFYENANGPVVSRGMETNVKVTFRDFKLFTNYALINTRLMYDNLNQQKPLTPQHNVGTVLIYEVENKWRIGYEAYYTGQQFREDQSRTQDYWIMGFMIMRKLNNISLYANFENFTDTRQHKMENFQIDSHFKPEFPQIWAPTDGSIINAGLIIDL